MFVTMNKSFFLLVLLTHAFLSVDAQNDKKNKLTLNGFGELYYSYDFDNPVNREKSDFIYNHKRHNEANANLLLLKARYEADWFRANLGVMTGNYAHYNLASEPEWARILYEANLGIKISKKQNLWIDAGILPSHIGFESAISADCWTLTRSILAENSPYYETGLKLSYSNNKENLNLAFLILNGWQRIRSPSFLDNPAVGVQINYKPTDKIVVNYSNFVGKQTFDTFSSLRTFHNFYVQYETETKFDFILGFDIGTDKYDETNYGVWYSPVGIVRYRWNPKIRIAARAEYYNDGNQIIVATNSNDGFRVAGVSTNFDYMITKFMQCRIEGKAYYSEERLFNNGTNYSLTTNLTFKL